MRKIYITLIFILVFILCSCDDNVDIVTDSVKIGYNLYSSSNEFSGFVALTLNVDSETDEITLLIEYGHDYISDFEPYKDTDHQLTVYVSENHAAFRDNGEIRILHEVNILDFGNDENLCNMGDRSFPIKLDCPNEIELKLRSEDIPYTSGRLFVSLTAGIFSDDLNEELPRVGQAIYFTNYDGELLFSVRNPNG